MGISFLWEIGKNGIVRLGKEGIGRLVGRFVKMDRTVVVYFLIIELFN